MKLQIDDPGAPVAVADLNAAERRSGRSLPPEYRQFLLTHNGGRPRQPCDFSMSDSRGVSQTGTVDRFLGVNTPEFFNLEHYLKIYAERVPPNLLPVAYDPGGNLLCLSAAGEDEGAVYFWDHEFESEEGTPPTRDNLYLVAPSFDQFLTKLCGG
ncbi:MAG: SMI1/KNR4 family protein [Acidobacteria bacterium]|nr:SMI1/KNR4 family protein [Acidobacteriota bacterium]